MTPLRYLIPVLIGVALAVLIVVALTVLIVIGTAESIR